MLRGRRVIYGGLVLGAAAAVLGWRWAHPAAPPRTPPAVAPADPALAAAVDSARAEVIARPDAPATWGRLGLTLLANGLSDPARECMAEAGRLDPDNRTWPYLEGVSLLLRDPVAALPCWQRAAECRGDDARAAAARLRWAEALLANDRPAEAEPVLAAVLAGDPDNPRARLDLGLLAATRADTGAAVEHLRKCVDSPSARRKACDRLAALYAEAGDPARAAEFARRASTLPPDQDWPDPILAETVPYIVGRESLLVQGEKYQQQGDDRQAAAIFDTLIRQYPDEARAYSKLGMILAEAGDYRGAEEVLRQGVRVKPDLVQAHFFLAVALFHQAERLGPATPGGKEKLRDAAGEARRATELKPDHGFAHLYRGLAAKHLGEDAEALASLREAVRCAPESTDPHLHLGQLLWAKGNRDEAVTELETAARLAGPNDQRPRAALDRVRAPTGSR